MPETKVADNSNDAAVKISAVDCTVHYGKEVGIREVSTEIPERSVTAFIGPSGCGKSTFLRCMNRMNDAIDGCEVSGTILLDGDDIYGADVDPVLVRARVGMVFQKPNPFPKSIYENVAYGPRIHGLAPSRADLDVVVEMSLRRASLWDEVKDRIGEPATGLSGGQQQRLCIARAVANSPEVLLMDEPCSSLDPIATARIEELIDEMRVNYTIIIVTHSMQQAARVSQRGRVLPSGGTGRGGGDQPVVLPIRPTHARRTTSPDAWDRPIRAVRSGRGCPEDE